MADDFDIEEYLEAQVDGEKQKGDRNLINSKEKGDGHDKHKKESKYSNDYEKEKERDRRKKKSRSRSRSRERKDRDRSRDRKERDRSRERKDRDRSRERKDRDRSREREERDRLKAERDAEALARREAEKQQKEINDLTKDQRTVFVSQLTMKVNEKAIKEFFTNIGKVNDVIMIRDKYTGRHKGFAYVEMADLEKIPTCLMLNGCVPDFQKFPILVKASEAEKNFLAKKEASSTASAAADNGLLQGADSRLYLGNLHVNITESDLKAVLSQFGSVEHVNIQKDELGVSRGYAFVRYSRPDEAQSAFGKLSGLELAGKPIKVGFVNDSGGSSNQTASGNWKLDDDEGSGMQMNAQSRVMLMAKLGQAAGINVPINPVAMALAMPTGASLAPVVETAKAPPVQGIPSRYFVVRNMFVLAEERGATWDEDIKEDVFDECKRFGTVEQVVVEKIKPGGFVYVKFANSESASKAANSLNGRWFAGRMITVTFLDSNQYSASI